MAARKDKQPALVPLLSVDRWVLPVLDLASTIVHALPLRLGYALADLVGSLTYRLWGAKRRAAHENFSIALALPACAPAVARTARRSFRGYARMVIDALRFRRMPIEALRRWIEIDGVEHLEAAHARGKGVIAVLPHVGNWEPASYIVARLPYRIVAVTDEGLVSRAIASSREAAGITIVAQSRAARPALRALRENAVVVLVADLVKDFRAAKVHLFGRVTHLPAGPAHLAVRTGAALLPLTAVRRADNSSLIRIEPPLYADPAADPAAEAGRLSQAIAAYFEGIIRRHPEQWYPYRPLWSDAHAARPL